MARPNAPGRVSRDRLTSPQEFRRVLRQGRSRGAGGLVVHVREREVDGQARLGLVVPGAVGTAVQRNRLKRQIRVAWATLREHVAPVDCVVVVRKRAVGTAYRELAGHLESCLRSLKVLIEPADAGLTGGTP